MIAATIKIHLIMHKTYIMKKLSLQVPWDGHDHQRIHYSESVKVLKNSKLPLVSISGKHVMGATPYKVLILSQYIRFV